VSRGNFPQFDRNNHTRAQIGSEAAGQQQSEFNRIFARGGTSPRLSRSHGSFFCPVRSPGFQACAAIQTTIGRQNIFGVASSSRTAVFIVAPSDFPTAASHSPHAPAAGPLCNKPKGWRSPILAGSSMGIGVKVSWVIDSSAVSTQFNVLGVLTETGAFLVFPQGAHNPPTIRPL
jgi:hypothetical protein